jgi:hypothetical protein
LFDRSGSDRDRRGALGCAVSFRHNSGGRSARRAGARLRGGCSRPQPRSHAVPWIEFFCTVRCPFWGYRGTVRDEGAFVIFANNISRFNNEPITARSTNCLCRSTRRVRKTSRRRDRQTNVSQIMQLLWPGSPICHRPRHRAARGRACVALRTIQQILRICTYPVTATIDRIGHPSNCAVQETNWESRRGATKEQADAPPELP